MTYQKWLAEYDRAYADPLSVGEQECPHCAARRLNLVFVQDTRYLEKGRPIFWCGNCLKGIFFGRVEYPENAKVITEEAERTERPIPNFRVIPPD
ncbi:hypothetical protein Acor_82810 [Acrocarpospora corrugata]|uniref:Uncharacterized protein n=1 Tax=Acrocarpospora corrugata TaxID=35763 RepID=A0A5M3WDQ7_9ACTN|nr:hypothetical protein [Acrocarpospora corrugata]GES06212.1 hypothetical protein Acor_82810 [Acrocarpospora corrugata]